MPSPDEARGDEASAARGLRPAPSRKIHLALTPSPSRRAILGSPAPQWLEEVPWQRHPCTSHRRRPRSPPMAWRAESSARSRLSGGPTVVHPRLVASWSSADATSDQGPEVSAASGAVRRRAWRERDRGSSASTAGAPLSPRSPQQAREPGDPPSAPASPAVPVGLQSRSFPCNEQWPSRRAPDPRRCSEDGVIRSMARVPSPSMHRRRRPSEASGRSPVLSPL
jgi:hypothetical protein